MVKPSPAFFVWIDGRCAIAIPTKKHEREVFRGRLNKDRRAVLSGKCLTAKSA
jgi:hypothetical protein